MRRFSEGMIIRYFNDGSLYRIINISDKEVTYKAISHGHWETREDLEYFSSLAPSGYSQKYRWEVVA